MTLDEAIKHCEEVAEDYRYQRDDAVDTNDFGAASDCQQCADDHEQLAEWLTELKDLREENKVLISECDRLIKEKGELLSKVSGAVEAADVQPVRRGKWDGYICSECNVCADYFISGDFYFDEKPDYCPNCGARMDGDTE